MWWLLLVFGVVGVCVTICMKLSDGLVSSGLASSPARAATQGCSAMRYSQLVVSLLWCGGEMLGMKSLCAGSGLKFGV